MKRPYGHGPLVGVGEGLSNSPAFCSAKIATASESVTSLIRQIAISNVMVVSKRVSVTGAPPAR